MACRQRMTEVVRIGNMRRLALAFPLAALLLVVGCSSTSHQLVGTWTGDIVPSTGSKNQLEAGFKRAIGAFIGPLTLEFNADGKYKASIAFGSATGTYTVSGNEVSLKQDEGQKDHTDLKFGKFILSSDGKSLESKKDFDSDSVIVLKKQQS